MILIFVAIGFVVGTFAAVLVLASGGGEMLAFASYSFAGALAIFISAVLFALRPSKRNLKKKVDKKRSQVSQTAKGRT